jgi:5-(carboxyamino)imidazole ribonucleotide synthase
VSEPVVLPGAAIGVLGSGQLGRMFAIAARRMGYRVHVLSPDADTPTGQVADLEFNAPYDDLEAVRRFASGVQVVSFEFENVPVETAECAARFAPVRPAGRVLHTTQNRIREKMFLESAGLPVTPFRVVRTAADVEQAARDLGWPLVLKTADWGYDGKGQFKVGGPQELGGAWTALAGHDVVAEKFIAFQSELSVVAARGGDGSFAAFPPITNQHRHHILDLSISPALIAAPVAQRAIEIAREVLTRLDVVGVMCVEFFVVGHSELLINELAPRPHNSGHLTIDAHLSCQFEQQVRAICGLPLGATDAKSPAAMANLLGDLWEHGEPDWRAACSDPHIKLHLYGKQVPRAGRKMGHLTALAATAAEATQRVLAARERLIARVADRDNPSRPRSATLSGD